MVKVAVLAFPMAYKVWGGVSWATYRTVEHMTALYPEDQFVLLTYKVSSFHPRVMDLVRSRDNLRAIHVDGKRAACKWVEENGYVVWGPSFGVLPTKKVPQVVTVHDMRQFTDYQDGGLQAQKHRSGLVQAFSRANAVVTISPSTFNDVLDWVPRHAAHLIPWGVPQGFLTSHTIEPKRPAEVNGQKYMTILYDPFPHKRLDLIKKVRPLLEEHDWDLVVIGPLRDSITPLRNPRVHYLGFVEEEDLPRYIKGSSLHLHTSEYEGFGHPPFEAMSLGVPVIYNWKCEALRGLIGTHAHYFDGDQDLEPRLDALMSCDETRMRHVDEAEEWVRAWDWETTAALYIDLFRRGGA